MDYDYDSYDTELQTEGEYLDPQDEYDSDFTDMTWDHIFGACVVPTLTQTFSSLAFLLVWNFVFRISTQLTSLPSPFPHVLSLICGLLCLQSIFPSSFPLLLVLPVLSYFPLLFHRQRGPFLLLGSITYLVFCELVWLDSRLWHQIRGPQMIIAMKVVSIGFDLDIGTMRSRPGLFQYAGYIFCPGTCVLGPWISFQDYCQIYSPPQNTFRSYWLWKMLSSAALAVVFLLGSTCFTHFLVPDSSWKWLLAYRDALSFRCSHYFVSYMSETTLFLSGFSEENVSVSKPANVELPRSLIQVVVSWNIPMHTWLKVYVFNTTRQFGNFIAIFSTYAVSSLLHGLNFQLAAVLLSLGLYSYVEFVLRKKLSNAFNACILARPCRDCCHESKWKHPGVLVGNFLFSVVTVIHLAYLGVMFDNSEISDEGYSYSHTVSKWSNLGFFSHWLAFGCYLVYFLI